MKWWILNIVLVLTLVGVVSCETASHSGAMTQAAGQGYGMYNASTPRMGQGGGSRGGVITFATTQPSASAAGPREVGEQPSGKPQMRAGEEVWVIAKAHGEAEREGPGCGELAAKVAKDGKEELIPVPLKHTDVKASVAGYISSTTVTQQFQNPYAEKIEAVYVFPLPENAAINEFVMTIGTRRIRGIIREREEATKIYNEAKSQGYVASLMTQERPNIFTQSVANIEPGKQIDVEITYYHTMAYADGWYEWVFPMVVGPRYNPAGTTDGVGAVGRGKHGSSGQATEVQYLKPGERSGHDIAVRVELNCPSGLEEIRCSSHQLDIQRPNPGRAIVSIAPADTLPNKDLVLRYRVAGDQIKSGVVIHRDQKGGYFNVMVYPPLELKDQARQPLEMVFLLDVSGSMSGQPIGQSKAAMRYAMSHMNPQDTFQVITFSGNNRVLFDRPAPVTVENIRKASQFIEGTEAGGGTEMLKAIDAALDGERQSGRGRVVVFLTDGYVGNEAEILRMTAQKLNGARIFAFGVGSSTNRFLMDGLARIGRGTVAYLGLRDSGEEVMQLYFERVAHPAMTDISVDFGQMKVTQMYPSRVPDLFVGRPITLTGKFEGELPREIRINGSVGDRRVSMTVAVDDQNQTNPALAAIWARQRITDLSEQVFVSPKEAGACEDLIRRTALDYGLMSKYTAFIAVDSSRRTEGDHGTSVAVPVAMPEGVKYETTVK